MKEEKSKPVDYDRPVAYDAEGRPLYAHPPVKIKEPVISDSTKLKHEKSAKLYPNLNLSDGEYVISSVRRHIIGLLSPLLGGTILIAVAFSILFNYDLISSYFKLTGDMAEPSAIFMPVLLFVAIVVISTYVTYFIFINNKMYLTNESVFQTIQAGLFTKREQTISLGNVEDASYDQDGIFQQLLNFGSIRLSTIGEEQTYRLTFVANPKAQVDVLNNAVEAFKNGRPVERS